MLGRGADGERLKNINAWPLRREGDCSISFRTRQGASRYAVAGFMPLVPDLRTSMVRSELLSVLLRSKITKSISRALLVEETDVFIDLLRHIVMVRDV